MDDEYQTATISQLFAYGEFAGETDPRWIALFRDDLVSGVVIGEEIMLPPARHDKITERFPGHSYEHQLLCARAAAWLEDRGYKWSVQRRDLYYAGGCVADVRALGVPLYVECGATRALKALKALADDARVLICPYIGEEDRGYLFHRAQPLRRMAYEEWCEAQPRRPAAGEVLGDLVGLPRRPG